MIYLSIGELIETHERGDFETVAKQVLLYGVIIEDKSWSEYGGHYRNMKVRHHDVDWTIKKHNGWVHFVRPMFNHV